MKTKINEKTNSKTDGLSEDGDLVTISWEASLGKVVQSFWESIDEDFEE